MTNPDAKAERIRLDRPTVLAASTVAGLIAATLVLLANLPPSVSILVETAKQFVPILYLPLFKYFYDYFARYHQPEGRERIDTDKEPVFRFVWSVIKWALLLYIVQMLLGFMYGFLVRVAYIQLVNIGMSVASIDFQQVISSIFYVIVTFPIISFACFIAGWTFQRNVDISPIAKIMSICLLLFVLDIFDYVAARISIDYFRKAGSDMGVYLPTGFSGALDALKFLLPMPILSVSFMLLGYGARKILARQSGKSIAAKV